MWNNEEREDNKLNCERNVAPVVKKIKVKRLKKKDVTMKETDDTL